MGTSKNWMQHTYENPSLSLPPKKPNQNNRQPTHTKHSPKNQNYIHNTKQQNLEQYHHPLTIELKKNNLKVFKNSKSKNVTWIPQVAHPSYGYSLIYAYIQKS